MFRPVLKKYVDAGYLGRPKNRGRGFMYMMEGCFDSATSITRPR